MKSLPNSKDLQYLKRAVAHLNAGSNALETILDWCWRTKRLKASEQRALLEIEAGREIQMAEGNVGAWGLAVINDVLARCVVSPRFDDWPAKTVRWIPARHLGKKQKQDAAAIQVIVYLAERGLLYRLRRCRCGRWFQGRENKQFHSVTCWYRNFRQSPEFKESQREYQRDYMRKQRKKLKADERQFKGGKRGHL